MMSFLPDVCPPSSMQGTVKEMPPTYTSDAINSLPRRSFLKSSLNLASFSSVPVPRPPRTGRADFYIYEDNHQCLGLSNPFLLFVLYAPHFLGFWLSSLFFSRLCPTDQSLSQVTLPQIGWKAAAWILWEINALLANVPRELLPRH